MTTTQRTEDIAKIREALEIIWRACIEISHIQTSQTCDFIKLNNVIQSILDVHISSKEALDRLATLEPTQWPKPINQKMLLTKEQIKAIDDALMTDANEDKENVVEVATSWEMNSLIYMGFQLLAALAAAPPPEKA